MTTIDAIELDPALEPGQLWSVFATTALRWLDDRALARRDAIIVLPFAELLAPCRQALARAGGWQPRVETLRTLSASIGPGAPNATDAPSGDLAIDRLLAQRLLARVPALRDWARRDRLAHDVVASDLIDAAYALMRAASAQPPDARAAWWSRSTQVVRRTDGPGALDAALAELALQWAATAVAAPTDHLRQLRPSAWIVLEAGGADALADDLMARAVCDGARCLRLVADAVGDDPFAAHVAATPRLQATDSAEDEAWAAAAAVIDAVGQGRVPVALVAQDRLLVRRIRALLDRHALAVSDETGWALSTTRAAARLMAWLRAARPAAGPDTWLDALKASTAAVPAAWTDRLERLWRRGGAAASAGRTPPDAELAQAIEAFDVQRHSWREFAAPSQQPLAHWLQALSARAGQALGDAQWRDDPAAAAVRTALRLDGASVRDDVDAQPMTLDEFIAWAEHALEHSTYIAPVATDAADVVVTPLARAMLRPFGAVVLPGADERNLGPMPPAPALLPEHQLRELGLDDRERRQRRGALAFLQLLRHRDVLVLRRRAEADEAIGASPWIDRLQLARRSAGLPLLETVEAHLRHRLVPTHPLAPPAATAGGALPDAVSASAVEALRACPYRFFARSVLALADAEELETDPDKRDFGNALHDALHRFHAERIDDDDERAAQRLLDTLRTAASDAGLDAAAMLPFAVGFDTFARRYLAWQRARDELHWRHESAEVAVDCAPEALDGLRLRGRIDRIDRNDGNGELQLIDYKTASVDSLRGKVRHRLEDTQLAFYAAQMIATGRAGRAQPLSASYVALDERDGIVEVPHAEVADSAQRLVDGLASDWRRMRAGEPLRALGEGVVCETCEMRGLCRRDHWGASGSGDSPSPAP